MLNLRSKRRTIEFPYPIIIVSTLALIVLRFLFNEKGRVTPDSIRFMRTAHVFPHIDNTVTPLGYPLSIKLFTYVGVDEFWASKLLGLLGFCFILSWAARHDFYKREVVMVGALFSYVSIFSYTISEALFIPVVFVLLYIGRNIIAGRYSQKQAILLLSIILIVLQNIRYSGLFFMVGCLLYGIQSRDKIKLKIFGIAAGIGFVFVLIYKYTFIDYFNVEYLKASLEFGLHPVSELLVQMAMGLTTTFNPFIHITNPAGGFINNIIYFIGLLNIFFIVFIFIKQGLSETEKFLIFTGVVGIICSFGIQFFYSVDPLDYRLLSPFVFPIWLVYFKKLFNVFDVRLWWFAGLCLLSGVGFIYLTKANYLENRKSISRYLRESGLMTKRILYYMDKENDPAQRKVVELISTVNPQVYISNNPSDTLNGSTLTLYRVSSKLELKQDRFNKKSR